MAPPSESSPPGEPPVGGPPPEGLADAERVGDGHPALNGRLLVATPGVLEDPNFRRTVVLLLEHGPNGALGVVLNRPTDASVTEHFPGWDEVTSSPAVMFVGGPVSQMAVIALGRPRPGLHPDGWNAIVGDGPARIGTVDLTQAPYELGAALEEVRVFAGYAGWGVEQLEGEIEMGAWFVVDADPDDPFSPDPDHLWRAILLRQGGRLAMYANYPDDLRSN